MRVGMIPENPLEWFLSKVNAIPFPVADAFVGMLQARAVIAGTRLGVFAALASGPASVTELARRLSCKESGLLSLLEALVSCGYLVGKQGKYVVSRRARKWIMPDDPQSVNCFIESTDDYWTMMGRLEEVIRTGNSLDLHDQLQDEKEWRRYLYGLHDLSKMAAKEMILRCPLARSSKCLLDIGGGHGGYAAAYCRRYPHLRAVIFDLPQAIAIGREIIPKYYEDVSARITFREGDVTKGSFGSGYDAILLLNIIHHFNPDQIQQVLKNIIESLNPGGRLLILDQIRQASRTASYLGSLAQLLFLVMTRGKSYSIEEVTGWIQMGGFSNVRVKNLIVGPGASVLSAVKK